MTDGTPERKIVLREKADRFACAAVARAFARDAGLSPRDGEALALAVAELASNVVRHAIEGVIELRVCTTPRAMVEVVCRDRGPGITDAEAARKDGYSGGRYLAPDTPRWEGLGLGLGAVERLVDDLIIHSAPGVGTTVVVRKWIR